MVFVGYGINDNILRVREKVDLMVFHSGCKHFHQSLLEIRGQWLRVLLSLSILWGRRERERLKQCESTQESLAHWFLDTTLMAWMAEVGKILLMHTVGMAATKIGR